MTRRLFLHFTCFGLIILLLSACASSPRMIASFPHQTNPDTETDSWLDYTANITLQVWNPKIASKQASSLVRHWGGYVESVRSDAYPGGTNIILELAVPSQYFYDLRQDLINLGTLVDEHIYGESSQGDPFHDPDPYSYLSLKLVPNHESQPPTGILSLNPRYLVQRAWMNAVKMARFLFKAALWFLVVAIPLFLFGYLLYRLGKRSNRNG